MPPELPPSAMLTIETAVNGRPMALRIEPRAILLDVLRDHLGLTGAKRSCDMQVCGACTVLLDGEPALSCITLAEAVGGREVTTIEGLREHPLVDAFVRADAVQCGFCTPGQIVSASALVERSPEPSREEIRHAMAGNLCRCGTYPKIEEAISSWRA
jgi:xanthine dehydrogenase YagT iron-sulfur-binding subunit